MLTLFCAVAAVSLSLSCGGATSEDMKVEDVFVQPFDGGITVHYRTRMPILDCDAQAKEVVQVWKQVVDPWLKDGVVKSVILFPEDRSPSRRSFSMEFAQRGSMVWSALAPCKIAVPER